MSALQRNDEGMLMPIESDILKSFLEVWPNAFDNDLGGSIVVSRSNTGWSHYTNFMGERPVSKVCRDRISELAFSTDDNERVAALVFTENRSLTCLEIVAMSAPLPELLMKSSAKLETEVIQLRKSWLQRLRDSLLADNRSTDDIGRKA